MARTKKRRYYRKFYRRYKNLNNSSYFRVKAEYYSRLMFPYAANNPHMYFDSTNNNIITLAQIMAGYSYKNVLAGLFSYYKITGIRVEITPDVRNQQIAKTTKYLNADVDVLESIAMVSYRAGDATAQTLSQVKTNNQSVLLDPNNKIVRYWRTYGATGSYRNTDEDLVGAFTLQNEVSQDDAFDKVMYVFKNQPSYKIKINIYLLYKQSKA